VNAAADRLQRFTGQKSVRHDVVEIPDLPSEVAVIGPCDGILYTAVRDGKTEQYIHKFRKPDRPLMCVSPDGEQIILVGGNYRFTELGIVDNSDRKHRNAR
jgi:hypothetical protein